MLKENVDILKENFDILKENFDFLKENFDILEILKFFHVYWQLREGVALESFNFLYIGCPLEGFREGDLLREKSA